ncbi:MAG: hypothetical protein P8130_02365 [Deltaproteobacteria bacterium]
MTDIDEKAGPDALDPVAAGRYQEFWQETIGNRNGYPGILLLLYATKAFLKRHGRCYQVSERTAGLLPNFHLTVLPLAPAVAMLRTIWSLRDKK